MNSIRRFIRHLLILSAALLPAGYAIWFLRTYSLPRMTEMLTALESSDWWGEELSEPYQWWAAVIDAAFRWYVPGIIAAGFAAVIWESRPSRRESRWLAGKTVICVAYLLCLGITVTFGVVGMAIGEGNRLSAERMTEFCVYAGQMPTQPEEHDPAVIPLTAEQLTETAASCQTAVGVLIAGTAPLNESQRERLISYYLRTITMKSAPNQVRRGMIATLIQLGPSASDPQGSTAQLLEGIKLASGDDSVTEDGFEEWWDSVRNRPEWEPYPIYVPRWGWHIAERFPL